MENSFHFFPLWKREAVKKLDEGGRRPLSGIPWPLNLPLPEFLHGFRRMKGDLTAFQKAKLLQEKILFLKTGHFYFGLTQDP
jgi:hypothetical protein